ncbi:hypothetical protein PIB30_090268 [Stylosanthes scabra]|uniref:Uncharacterized protein n=1 Tax=Stylosanthes scabra TaxID=79078 RepID=A0ABU6ZSW8_9FABA|nr:hypothetical protein [Stylosanthes scabra]
MGRKAKDKGKEKGCKTKVVGDHSSRSCPTLLRKTSASWITRFLPTWTTLSR